MIGGVLVKERARGDPDPSAPPDIYDAGTRELAAPFCELAPAHAGAGVWTCMRRPRPRPAARRRGARSLRPPGAALRRWREGRRLSRTKDDSSRPERRARACCQLHGVSRGPGPRRAMATGAGRSRYFRRFGRREARRAEVRLPRAPRGLFLTGHAAHAIPAMHGMDGPRIDVSFHGQLAGRAGVQRSVHDEGTLPAPRTPQISGKSQPAFSPPSAPSSPPPRPPRTRP